MMGFGFGGLGAIYMLVFWVIIIVLAIWLLSRLFPKAKDGASHHAQIQGGDSSESAVEILRRRYARGEISKDQYEEMRRDITA
jgi:putative membrane protein